MKKILPETMWGKYGLGISIIIVLLSVFQLGIILMMLLPFLTLGLGVAGFIASVIAYFQDDRAITVHIAMLISIILVVIVSLFFLITS